MGASLIWDLRSLIYGVTLNLNDNYDLRFWIYEIILNLHRFSEIILFKKIMNIE